MLRNSLAAKLFPSSNSSCKRRRFCSSRRHSLPRPAKSLRMEALEDRVVLSAMAVTNLNDSGPGSLRAAIDAANSSVGVHDVIEFAPGVKGTISLTDQLEVTDDLTINGPGKGALTISGSEQDRVFDVTGTSLAVDHITIADGHATYDGSPGDGGGGIRANGSAVNLEHVGLENNRFEGGENLNITGGGAIKANASIVTLNHVTVRNNEATDLVFIGLGGAISMQSSSLNVNNSNFEGNRISDTPDAWGGAIGSRMSQVVISNSRFDGNQADGNDGRGRGGAIMATTGGSLDVDNSRFHGNSAVGETGQGGAIVAFQGVQSTISNSQFVHNFAKGDTAQGGAIWNARGGRMTIENSSVVNNRAIGEDSAEGGGVHISAGNQLELDHTNVNANQAIGASGVGGGIFNFFSRVSVDKSSNIHGNKASISHDDVFGSLTLLEDALALV